jgi:hypothetical protein
MIFFFGTRPGKTLSTSLPHVACGHCQQKGTLTVYQTPNYVHFFWIKIIKIGTFRHAECSHCKRVYDDDEFTEDIQAALTEQDG